jgi:carbonic anhydrase
VSVTDELLERNERYAASFTKGDLPMPPARKVVGPSQEANVKPWPRGGRLPRRGL